MRKSITAVLLVLTIITAAMLGSCARETAEKEGTRGEPDRLRAAVSILPQKSFVQAVAGDLVEVVVMVPPGNSPSIYEPTTQQLQELSQSEVFFTIGVPFEESFVPLLEENLPDLEIVPTDTGTPKRRFRTSHILEEDEEDGEHEGEEEGAVDPHIWMSPISVISQAQIIAEKLIELDPENRDTYRENLESFTDELRELDRLLARRLRPLSGETILVYHPAFGYFADRYNLEQKAVEIGGKEPSPRDLEKLIAVARKDEVSIIFVQPEFSKKSAQAIADAIGARVITIGSLDPDYMDNLLSIAEALESLPRKQEEQ